MKELTGKKLKENIRTNIIKAINDSTATAQEITITFICDNKYKPKEKISIFGHIRYKDVSLRTLTKEQAINLIVDNMYYDNFSFISNKTRKGKIECHGHGEFWATDETSIIYARIK